MTTDFDFDDEPTNDEEEVVVVEEEAPSRSPLRAILLIVLAVVLVCCLGALALRTLGGNLVANLPIPGLGAPEVEAPVIVPEEEEATAPAEETTEVVVPAPEAEEPSAEEPVPAPGAEETVVTEMPAEEAVEPLEETVEPLEETVEPAEEMVEPMEEETVEPAEEMAEPTVTVVVVPGPTATQTPVLAASPTTEAGPTVVVTTDACQDNDPPVAQDNGPYTAMLGKGQAFITFKATGSSDPDGSIVKYEWDFGDGVTGTGQTATHGYTSAGSYTVTLTVTDNCGATGQSTTQATIVGRTPPANNNNDVSAPATATAPPPATAAAQPASVTVGFCYLVQPGNTLFGIAQNYGVSLEDLAEINRVSSDYLVAVGQGIFIPTGEINPGGRNVYQVQSGDTLTGIASQCGLSVTALASANNIAKDANLVPGQFIVIPTQ